VQTLKSYTRKDTAQRVGHQGRSKSDPLKNGTPGPIRPHRPERRWDFLHHRAGADTRKKFPGLDPRDSVTAADRKLGCRNRIEAGYGNGVFHSCGKHLPHPTPTGGKGRDGGR